MSEELVFCEECRDYVTCTVKSSSKVATINGQDYHYEGTDAICDNCGKYVYVPKIQDENLNSLNKVLGRYFGITEISKESTY